MDKSDSNTLFEQVNEARDAYYEENGKNKWFKSSQKNDLANHVCNNFDLTRMIQCTAYAIPNTNKLYFSYPLFKTYGSPENCCAMSDYIKDTLIPMLLNSNTNFEMHVNLKGFTVSACQRFFTAIRWLFEENTELTNRTTRLYIYHTPNVIDQIRKLLYVFIKDILERITHYYKDDSDAQIALLHDF
jgi:hypothetical protein